jgi:hypothetical protein
MESRVVQVGIKYWAFSLRIGELEGFVPPSNDSTLVTAKHLSALSPGPSTSRV